MMGAAYEAHKGTKFEPIQANSSGHLLHVWIDDDAQMWACCAYDHGPMCRLCQQVADDDDTLLGLLQHVAQGNMEVSAEPDGSFRFKLTEQGNERARKLIETPGEAQELYDQLVTTEMEKNLGGDDGGDQRAMTERDVAMGFTADEMRRRVVETQERMSGFAAEMREKGIHVGMGSDPHCVTCGEQWPCAKSRAGDGGD